MSRSPVIDDAVIVGGEWPADEVVGVPSGWKKKEVVGGTGGWVGERARCRARKYRWCLRACVRLGVTKVAPPAAGSCAGRGACVRRRCADRARKRAVQNEPRKERVTHGVR
jgi:hypothetical protein